MKVLIVGSGFGQYGMAPVYRGHGCTVEVVTPRNQERLKAAMAEDFDLVSIHSPPFLHHEHVTLAIANGKNILCDKPFGRNVAEARDMRDKAKAAGNLHFLNCEFRCNPSRARFKALIEEGRIGVPQHFHTTFFSNGLRGRNHGWLTDAEKGGGWIGAYGSHFIDTVRWLFDSEVVDAGGLVRTETRMRPDGNGNMVPSTAEDAFSIWVQMANGGTACLDTAFSGSVPIPTRALMMGDQGALELVGDTRLLVRLAFNEDPSAPLTREERLQRAVAAAKPDSVLEFEPPAGEPHEPSLRPWLADVLAAIRDKRQIAPNFDDATKVAETLEMIRNNATKGGMKSRT